MTESFLHYLWEYQYFNKTALCTTTGEDIQVFNPGKRNIHSGPDFFDARVRIGDMEWVGSVEIHIYSGGWIEHKHNLDAGYNNVVLHVVWSDDKIVKRSDGSRLPTLELKNRVDEHMLLHFKSLVYSPEPIPCSPKLQDVNALTVFRMLDKVIAERLETKATVVLKMLSRNGNDWEETCYQMLSKNFGFKVNSDPFHQLSLALPYRVLMKHADKLEQVEALLFGQAGFLDEGRDDAYYLLLSREYKILNHKYRLEDRKLNKVQWRFLRMRPANFPTIRIAQLAGLVHMHKKFFSSLMEIESAKGFADYFSVRQSEYWLHHYHFFKEFKKEIDTLGGGSIDNLIINTVVPLLVAYGKAKSDRIYIDRAIFILQHLRGESNSITKQWKDLGMNVRTAFESQAMVGLYNTYCLKRRCLDCNIGTSLINPNGK